MTTDTTTHADAPEAASPPAAAAEAFAAIAAEIDALEPEAVQAINIDVPRAAVRAIGAASAIRALATQVPARLPAESPDAILKLETYALAAWYAHVVHSRVSSRADVKKLLGDAKRCRQELLVCAELLARMGHVDAERVAAIRSGNGKLDLASDLVAVSALLDAAWPQIAGKVPLQQEDIKRGSALGAQLLSMLGDDSATRLLQAQTAERRVRAFTLLVRTYDACRRIVTYLRWADRDVESLVPSLFDNIRGRRRRRRGAPDATAADASAGGTDAPRSITT